MKLLITFSILMLSLTVWATPEASPVPTPDVSLSEKTKPQTTTKKEKSSTTPTSKDLKKKPAAKSSGQQKPTAVKPHKIVRKVLTDDQKKELKDWLDAKVKRGEMSQKQSDEAFKYSEVGVYDVMKSETARKKK